MIISQIDFEIKKPRNITWRIGIFGNLKEQNFGANSPAGMCKLFIGGVMLDQLTFRNAKERHDIFDFWNRRYLNVNREDGYIEVSYHTINIKDRSLKYATQNLI